jgi:hypothetical protein
LMDTPGGKIIFTGELYSYGREAGRDFRNFCHAMNKSDDPGIFRKEKRQSGISEDELIKNREGDRIKAENGINRLLASGSIIQSSDGSILREAIRADYMKNPQNSIVLARSWREKNELNGFIRAGFEKTGAVANSALISVRSGDIFNGQACLKKDIANYEEGHRIEAISNVRGMKKGETGTIIGMDASGRSVKVAIGGSRRIALINPGKDYKKYSVWETREEKFGRGDRILFLRSWESGIKRGETAVIESIDNNMIKVLTGNRKVIVFDHGRYNYFDHAYAASGPLPFSRAGKNILLDLRAPHGRSAGFGAELEHHLAGLKPGTRIYTDNIGMLKARMAELGMERVHEREKQKYIQMGIGM